MRIFLSADMEGINGVVHPEQTKPGAREYDRACALMLAEVNAAIEGAFAGGATQLLVSDSHWNMRNLDLGGLDLRAELISGSPRPLSMMEGITEGWAGAIMLGYHAMAGTATATIDHTYTYDVLRVAVNQRAVGELGLNALLAGYYGVPVIMVSGDQMLAAEARDLLGPDLAVAQVKTALSRGAARCLPFAQSLALIRTTAHQAVANLAAGRHPPALRPASPCLLEVEFARTDQAAMAALLPSATVQDGRSMCYHTSDYPTLFRAWRALYNLAGS